MTGELSQHLQVNLCIFRCDRNYCDACFLSSVTLITGMLYAAQRFFAVLFLAYYCQCGRMLNIYHVTYIAGGKQADRAFSISLEY